MLSMILVSGNGLGDSVSIFTVSLVTISLVVTHNNLTQAIREGGTRGCKDECTNSTISSLYALFGRRRTETVN